MNLPPSCLRWTGIALIAVSCAPVVAQAADSSVAAPASQAASAAASVPAKAPAAPSADAKATDSKLAELKHYIITDFGAVGDDDKLNTSAIQKAIDTAAAAGGGVVEVPKGRFYSGAIFLKKGVELYLDEGGVLSGSQDIKDFPVQQTRIEGHFTQWPVAFINASQIDHLRIGGKGQITGNGQPYWAAFRAARGAANLDVPRPRLMFIDRCNDVKVEGIAFQDSGFWNLHLYHCNGAVIDGLSITAPSGSPSTDGIDVDSCQNVTIRNCYISNNDDDIALKGSKGPLADKDTDSPPDENITISNCTIGNGNGLLTCGSEATIVRNVLVTNCTIEGNAKMLTIKLRPDTPQHYSNITLDGITLNGGGSIISAAPWTQYFDLQGQPGPARSVDHIVIRNVKGTFGSFGSVRGNQPNEARGTLGDTLSDFTFENINVQLTGRNPMLTRGEVANFTFKNVIVNDEPVEAPAASSAPAGRGGGGGAPPVTPRATGASAAAASTASPVAPAAATSTASSSSTGK